MVCRLLLPQLRRQKMSCLVLYLVFSHTDKSEICVVVLNIIIEPSHMKCILIVMFSDTINVVFETNVDSSTFKKKMKMKLLSGMA